jgi:myo-inositol-1(or 4)-monophosphatase
VTNSHIYHGTCTQAVGKALLFLESISSRELTFTEKESPRDLVSAADMAVHNMMCHELAPTGIPLFSEENAASHAPASDSTAKRWILDPIDGTTNFAARIPLYGISLGFMEGETFIAGAFGMPATRELFYTVSHDASYLNDARLRSDHKTLAHSLVGACFSARAGTTQQAREKEFLAFGMVNDRSRGCVRLGSAGVSICYTAAGKLGAAYGIACRIWDVAAALAVAQAAGCRILTAQTADALAISFIVGHGDAASEIRTILREVVGVNSWQER